MPSRFLQTPKIVVFTGPGLSREAGFAPFDPATMPPATRLEDVVTGEGYARNPAGVQAFYNRRRRELGGIQPSRAHAALAALDLARPHEILVVTRNIDDLHERAGSRAVLHTHGELLKARCAICTKLSDRLDDLSVADECPVCGNPGHLRPHIVWVGEAPLAVNTVCGALAACSTFVSIGNAGAGEPGCSFLADAKRAGARTLEFAGAPTPASHAFDQSAVGRLSETVPDWAARMIAAP